MAIENFEEEIKRLSSLLNNTQAGCLVFGIYDTVANRTDIVNSLKSKLKVSIYEFHINNEKKNPLELIQDINPTEDHLVICLYDIEKAFPEVLGYLNYQREAFFKQKWGLLFLITEFGRNEIANKAPDFWSRRSGVFDFRIEDYKQILNARGILVAEPISYQSKEELLKKLNLYKTLLEEYKIDKEPDEKAIAKLFLKIGQIYSLTADYTQSYEWFNKSMEIFEKIGDNKGVAYSLNDMGLIYQKTGNYDDALKNYNKALRISEKIGDIRGVAISLHNVGMIYQNTDKYDDALKNYYKSLGISEKIGDIQNVAGSLHEIGRVYQNTGKYDDALKNYNKSLEISEKIGDIQGSMLSLLNIGIIYQNTGKNDDALKNYNRSLEISEKIGDLQNIASSLHNIGIIYQNAGKYEEALNDYRKALEIFEKIGDIHSVANSNGQISVWYFDKKDYITALKFSFKAYSIYLELGSPNINLVKRDILKIKDKISEEEFNEILKEFNVNLE